MNHDEALELVRSELAEIMEIDPATISSTASFVEDLRADSLALIELVEALEAALRDRTPGFRIEDDDLERLITVDDAAQYITSHTAS